MKSFRNAAGIFYSAPLRLRRLNFPTSGARSKLSR